MKTLNKTALRLVLGGIGGGDGDDGDPKDKKPGTEIKAAFKTATKDHNALDKDPLNTKTP